MIANPGKPSPHQRRIAVLTQAQGDIDALGENVHYLVLEQQVDFKCGLGCAQRGKHGQDDGVAIGHRRRDADYTRRGVGEIACLVSGLLHILQ